MGGNPPRPPDAGQPPKIIRDGGCGGLGPPGGSGGRAPNHLEISSHNNINMDTAETIAAETIAAETIAPETIAAETIAPNTTPPSNNPLYFIYIVARCWFAAVECIFFRTFTERYSTGSLFDAVLARTRDIMQVEYTHPTYDPTTDIVLANHRTIFDPMFSQEGTAGIGRTMYAIVTGPMTWCAFCCGQSIIISRGKTDRTELYRKIRANRKSNGGKPTLIYPEGTRCRLTSMPDDPADIALKPGAIKMIYDNDMKFQILTVPLIERVADERTWLIQHGVALTHTLSAVIDPAVWKRRGAGLDCSTDVSIDSTDVSFDAFFLDVKRAWKRGAEPGGPSPPHPLGGPSPPHPPTREKSA